MALHIADAEVSRLTADLARLEKTTKTEALRRVLREAVKQRETAKKRKGLEELMDRIIAEARAKGIQPASKEEFDALSGMDELLGR